MTAERRPPPSSEPSPLSVWLARSAMAGSLLGLVEVLFAALSGYNLPLSYLLLVLAFDLAGCTLLGVALAGADRLLRVPRRGGFDGAFPPLAAAMVFFFLVEKVASAAQFRHLSAPLAVVAFAAALLAGCLVGPGVLRRLCRSPHADLSLWSSLLLLSLWLVGGRHLTKSLLQAYFSWPGLLGNLLLLALLSGLLWLQDRLLARLRPRAWRRTWRLALLTVTGTVILTTLVWAASLPSEPAPAEPPPRAAGEDLPNVILITLDTLRRDRLSLYGYERATDPNLVAFARDAVVYDNAVSPSSWTLPAHGSIFTGTLPRRHGAHYVNGSSLLPARPLHPDNVTLAEILRERGYRTAGVAANFGYLHPDFGLAQGFDFYDARPHFEFSYEPGANAWLALLAPEAYECFASRERPAEKVNDAALRWVRENRGARFFLFLNYLDPHNPYCPPAPFDRLFPGKRSGVGRSLPEFKRARQEFSPAAAAHFAALYDGEVTYLDRQLGLLLDELKRLDLYDDALIVMTSDHGEFFGEHRLWEHGYGAFEEVYRVPLLIKYPHGAGRRREPALVSTLQILPTLLDHLALPSPATLDAVALTLPGQRAITEQYVNEQVREDVGEGFEGAFRTLYEWPWKLVLYADGERDLFDLVADPGENQDLAGEHPEVADAMSARLLRYMESIEPPSPTETHDAGIDSQLYKRLKALGYLQ